MYRPLVLLLILALVLGACQTPAATPPPTVVLPPSPTIPTPIISLETPEPSELPTPAIEEGALAFRHDPDAAQTAILIPVTMYYLERHIRDVGEKTDLDKTISRIFEEYPDSEMLLRRSLERYLSMDIDARMEIYDPLAVRLTADASASLDLEKIREQLGLVNPNLVVKDAYPPVAPSSLTATNASYLADPDETADTNHRISLKWQDNSNNEHGFMVYRFNPLSLAGVKAQLIASLGSNVTTYTDILQTPVKSTDQYCYVVVAYRNNPIAMTGQPPVLLESGASNTSCSLYTPDPPAPLPDGDQDGWPDQVDKCPTIHDEGAYWTEGCPDDDEDGWDNLTDQCKQKWGELPGYGGTAPMPQPGCPILYNLRWMKMEVLNNSIHSVDSFGVYRYNEGGDAFPLGEEPYLVFTFVNGSLQGMPISYSTRWCCGEEINIKNGKKIEPDNDFSGEENPSAGPAILAKGLQIFPGLPAVKADELDREIGMTMAVTLLERDWTMLITPEQKTSQLDGISKIAGTIAGTIATCVGSMGFGCLASIGSALKGILEGILDLSSEDAPVEVQDPDDFMGTDTWYITRSNAQTLTSDTGAYGFWFEMPTTYYGACYGIPCNVSWSVPATMRARVYFCLARDGVPQNQLQQLCAPYAPYFP